MFTTPPQFTVGCCWGLAAMLVLYHPPIIRIYNHFRRTMLAPLQKRGSTYIPRKKQTVPDALSVAPLLTYLMAFQVPFVIVDSAVQRKISKNSNAFFAKLFHCQTSLPSLLPKSTKTLLFLTEVILLVATPLIVDVLHKRSY